MALPERLLVATDFSEYADRASDLAIEWASRLGGELHFVHCVEHLSSATTPSAAPLAASYVEQARRRARQRLGELAERARGRGLAAETHVVDSPIASAVIRLATDHAVDCIWVGTRGHTGLRRFWLGGVAERIVREAPCSVLVVRGERSPLTAGEIIIGDDLTPLSTPPRDFALALASTLGAHTTVIHALDLGIPYLSTVEVVVPTETFDALYVDAQRRLDKAAADAADVAIENVVVSDRAAAELCERAEKTGAGLVVVGSHSRHGIERALLGSVAERVVRHAPCSVLVVRD